MAAIDVRIMRLSLSFSAEREVLDLRVTRSTQAVFDDRYSAAFRRRSAEPQKKHGSNGHRKTQKNTE